MVPLALFGKPPNWTMKGGRRGGDSLGTGPLLPLPPLPPPLTADRGGGGGEEGYYFQSLPITNPGDVIHHDFSRDSKRESDTRLSASGFFHISVDPHGPPYPIGAMSIFAKIRKYIFKCKG